jgi:hypothetical protein
MLQRGGQSEIKRFAGLAEDANKDAFTFTWGGSRGGGDNPDRIPFVGGKSALLSFLRGRGKPKFKGVMISQFMKSMRGESPSPLPTHCRLRILRPSSTVNQL